jgi:phospholipid/cholesterol/gamma-HCH transport system ATP-binding protein
MPHLTSDPIQHAVPSHQALVRVQDLGLAQRGQWVLRRLNFEIRRGEVLVIVGPSGCGKSTLLRHLVGLQAPATGHIFYGPHDLNRCGEDELATVRRQFGVMFQSGALWSAMTVGDNLMLPMRLFTSLNRRAREEQARFKLALVGLDDCFDMEPAALSGGMKKRAAIARALALDPPLLFLDEPGSGLDPVNSAHLDSLILKLREQLGTTVVMVTHDIDSVFAVADRSLFLDEQEQTMTALGAPQALLANGPPAVREFLQRGRGVAHPAPLSAVTSAPKYDAPRHGAQA